jgi:hypothetical protein
MEQLTDAVRVFRGGGGRAHRDGGSISLLKGCTRKLGAKLLDHFVEVREGLDFVEQGCVGGRKLKQLNADGVTGVSKSGWDKHRCPGRHDQVIGNSR